MLQGAEETEREETGEQALGRCALRESLPQGALSEEARPIAQVAVL